MFSQSPQDNATREERLIAGLLIRQQLEQAGARDVADFFKQPDSAMAGEPSVTITRRRGRPFSPIEATVVANEDADYANDLLALTRTIEGDAAEQAQKNSDLYKLLMQSKFN